MSPGRVAALLAVALATTAVTGCSVTAVKDEAVVLTDVRGAYVTSDDGERPATDGQRLEKGDTVHTDADGTATLVVRDRRVVLDGRTNVTVPDGASVQLSRGILLVDRREGPGLTVVAGDTTVDNVGSGALRVEKSFAVLVAGLSAGARISTATGQRLTLDRLYQVAVSGRALPRAAQPLQLRLDEWERTVVPDLVADDERLNVLAAGLDGPGAVVPVAYRATAGAKRSDLVLADAIGRAAADTTTRWESRAQRARLLRAAGGSWGVVAHILETSAVEVGSALSDVLRGVPATDGSPTASPTPGAVVANPPPEPGVTRTPAPSEPTRSPGSTRPSTTPPTTGPTSPTQTPGPVDELVSAIPTPPWLPDLLP